MSSSVRIPDGFVDELKARIRPSDVIGRKVKLTKKGKEWVGLSPFTNEKTPSFYVNDQKRIFKCFSSGMGGDVISFIMETERLSFMEAVEKLAEEAGMELPKADPRAAEAYDHRKRLQEVCEAAAAYFEERLQSSEGSAARDYLEGRGLKPLAWKRHRLGYAPDDWRKTINHLKSEGFTQAEILEAGLAKESDRGGEPYDAFRGRLMFPIPDSRGGIIAFGGRGLTPDAKPKYLNSGDTPLFHKSRVLYRYKAAREALGHGEDGGLIVCEGYMDAIALTEAGFGQAVAPLGTALTEEQISLLWRAGPEPVLCFDGDRAGLGAAYRAVDRALPHVEPGRSLFFVLLPDGMDPDDLIRERGPAAMGEALEARIALSELLWLRERDAEPLDTPERQAGLEARLMQAAAQIRHPGVKAAYERDLRARMRDHFWQIRQAKRQGGFTKGKPGGRGPGMGAQAGLPTQASGRQNPGMLLLMQAIANPDILSGMEETLIAADFRNETSNRLRDVIVDFLIDDRDLTFEAVVDELRREGHEADLSHIDVSRISRIRTDEPAYRSWKAAVEVFIPVETAPSADDEVRRLKLKRRLVAERRKAHEERILVDQQEKAMGKANIGDFWKQFEAKNPWFKSDGSGN
ncbi:DNA primase [Hyphomonas sp.]|uniref:DNA primase n=1 Tax=Hyphomonas sp. TaxID=87 RepID=UPI0025C3B007|nr:DNA primase [Hyphomonas sp.]